MPPHLGRAPGSSPILTDSCSRPARYVPDSRSKRPSPGGSDDKTHVQEFRSMPRPSTRIPQRAQLSPKAIDVVETTSPLSPAILAQSAPRRQASPGRRPRMPRKHITTCHVTLDLHRRPPCPATLFLTTKHTSSTPKTMILRSSPQNNGHSGEPAWHAATETPAGGCLVVRDPDGTWVCVECGKRLTPTPGSP